MSVWVWEWHTFWGEEPSEEGGVAEVMAEAVMGFEKMLLVVSDVTVRPATCVNNFQKFFRADLLMLSFSSHFSGTFFSSNKLS